MKRLSILLGMVFLLGSCNMPDEPSAPSGGSIHTVAAQTVAARMTESGTESTPATQQPTQSQNAALPSATQPPPTAVNTPPPSFDSDCDHITWGADITIPDDTTLQPGQVFTKTWRLKNSGTCTWTSNYALVLDSGHAMQAPAYVQITTDGVGPGQMVDISITLVAPIEHGEYQGFFKLRNANGVDFGLGDSSNPFWVKIRVSDEAGVVFDFIARANEATWGSGTTPINFAKPGHQTVTYGGQVSDDAGYANVQDNLKIEDGETSGKILRTDPKNEQDGYIVGRYPIYTVGLGDRLSGSLGFLPKPNGSCGVGRATFRIYYTLGDDMGTLKQLDSWEERCDGEINKINLDLDTLVGKSVRFYLAVLASGSPEQDWAVWSSLGVVR